MTKVLVTGAAGFIGSHLVHHLIRKGVEVRAMTRYYSSGYLGQLEVLPQSVRKEIEIIRGDIKDPDFCTKAIQGCEYVFHLAALIAIPFSYHNPTDYVQTNVLGTTHLLNASRYSSTLKRFIHTSTSEVYGTAQYLPIDEKHPIHPQSPYAASKVAADALVKSYHLSFGLPTTTIRPFNTYGPRQSNRAIIPTIISQLLTKGSVSLGNLLPKRDFLYVKDTVGGFWEVGTHGNTLGQTLNLGTGEDISIGQLYQVLCKLTQKEPTLLQDKQRMRPQNSEVFHLLANTQKAEQLTNWKPQYSLEEGLSETIEWISNNLDRFLPNEYVL